VCFPWGATEEAEWRAREILTGIEVIHRAGGRDKLVEELKRFLGEEKAKRVVELLEKEPERYFDYYFAKGGFRMLVEIKQNKADWAHKGGRQGRLPCASAPRATRSWPGSSPHRRPSMMTTSGSW
jgi:hypothetical protein